MTRIELDKHMQLLQQKVSELRQLRGDATLHLVVDVVLQLARCIYELYKEADREEQTVGPVG